MNTTYHVSYMGQYLAAGPNLRDGIGACRTTSDIQHAFIFSRNGAIAWAEDVNGSAWMLTTTNKVRQVVTRAKE